MNLESIRHRYLRSVIAPMFRGMGLRAGTAIACRLARGLCRMDTPSRRRAEARLRAALADAGADREVDKLLAAMYQHQARFWTEALFIPRRLREKSWRRHVHVEDEADLQTLAESKRGCVLATAYFGNIAAAACALGQIFRPVHVMVDWLAQPALASWQRSLYAQPQVRPIDVREAGRVLPQVLSGGGAVFMVCEHERQRARGIPTRYLGRDLNCPPTLGRLARWFDVPIGVLTCRRNPRLFSFSLALHAVVEHDSTSTDDGSVVRQVMAALDDAVMQNPEQYLWSTPSAPGSAGGSAVDPQKHIGRPRLAVIQRGALSTHHSMNVLTRPTEHDAPSTEKESGSASSRRKCRRASASQSRSAADKTRAEPVAAAEPGPRA